MGGMGSRSITYGPHRVTRSRTTGTGTTGGRVRDGRSVTEVPVVGTLSTRFSEEGPRGGPSSREGAVLI